MQYIILLPQLTHIELFCTKIIQRASTRLERYLVQKPWISWNIQISISFSCFPLLLQSHLTEGSTFWHFFLLDFLPHFSALYTFHHLLQKFSSLFLFHFCFYPAMGLASIVLSQYRKTTFCVSLGEGKIDCVFDTNLYITLGSKYAPGHPAGLGLNCKMTQCCIPVKILHKF